MLDHDTLRALLDMLGIVLGAASFLWVLLGRLRHINWQTSRPGVVALYLAFAVWSLFVVRDGLEGGLEWYQVLSLSAVLMMLFSGRKRWEHGAPAGVTKPAELGPVEGRAFLESRS